jgi:hypothetical protein
VRILRRGGTLSGGVALAVALIVGCAPPVAAASGVTWQSPISPGGVTTGNLASATLGAPTVSCWSAGSCDAVGTYTDTTGANVLFVSTETSGVWGVATTLGQTPSGASQPAELSVTALACVSSANCALAGTFVSATTGASAVFVAAEESGVWGTAAALPGLAALDTGSEEQATDLVCSGAGQCTVAGTYLSDIGETSVYTSSLSSGTWSDAVTLPDATDAESPEFATVSGLSCPVAGGCTLVGTYADDSGDYQVLLDNESSGTWSVPTPVSGVAALNSYFAQGTAVWCAGAGSCEFAGTYTDTDGATQGFVAAESDGSVTTAGEVPGLGTLNAGGEVSVSAIGCIVAGSCIVGGSYSPDGSNTEAFVEAIDGGTPQSAEQLPGWTSIDYSTGATTGTVTNVTCETGGCAVAGTYSDVNGVEQVFGDTESADTWDTVGAMSDAPTSDTSNSSSVDTLACDTSLDCDLVATGSTSSGASVTYEVAGSDTAWTWSQLYAPAVSVLLTGNAAGGGITCWEAGYCEAVGWYQPTSLTEMPWSERETAGVWGPATAISLITTNQYVAPTSVSCVNQYNCVVVVAVADTINDGENFNSTPMVLIESAGVWGSLTEVTVVNPKYAAFAPSSVISTCSGGACHVLVDGDLENGTQTKGSETAVANVINGQLTTFTPLDIDIFKSGQSLSVYPSLLTCAHSTQCVEVDEDDSETLGVFTTSSVVHRLSGSKWTTIAHLSGTLRTEGIGSNSFHVRGFTLNSASCTSSGFCEFVGSETPATGPSVAAIGMTLINGQLSRPFTLGGYPKSPKDTSTANSVSCFGVNCVVTGEADVSTGSSSTTEVIVSALKGANAATIASVTLDGFSLSQFQTVCTSPRNCLQLIENYSEDSGNVTWDYDSLQGSHLTRPAAIPNASLATEFDGLSAAPGGEYELLFDEGSVVSTPLILQT